MQHTSKELLHFYRDEIRFQSDLLASRLGALMTAQSFLVIAYASFAGALIDNWAHPLTLTLVPAFAILGFVLTLQATPGIKAAWQRMKAWQVKEEDLLDDDPELAPFDLVDEHGNRDRIAKSGAHLYRATKFNLRMPQIFMVAWIAFGIVPWVLYFTLGSSG